MAVHLNARLKTRFIPYLFTIAVLVIVTAALAHANTEEGTADSEDTPSVTHEELQAVMSESVDPARLDRRPGFSEITVAPRPGERPTTGPLNARTEVSDELSTQPEEPSSDK